MRVKIQHDKADKSRYLVLANEAPVGSIYLYPDGWQFNLYHSRRHLWEDELVIIRAAAKKKCTTLNILKRLTS